MAEPDDMILPLLREMRADINARFEAMGGENSTRHKQIIARLDGLDERYRSFNQALTADSLLSKLVTGEFEQRIEALERKVRELETQK